MACKQDCRSAMKCDVVSLMPVSCTICSQDLLPRMTMLNTWSLMWSGALRAGVARSVLLWVMRNTHAHA